MPQLLLSKWTGESVLFIVAGKLLQPFSPEGIRAVRFQRLHPANAMRSQSDDQAKGDLTLSKLEASRWPGDKGERLLERVQRPRVKSWRFETLVAGASDTATRRKQPLAGAVYGFCMWMSRFR